MWLVNGEEEEEEEAEAENEENTGRLILALLESAFEAGAATMLIHLSSDSCCLPLCCMFVDTFSMIFCTLPFAGKAVLTTLLVMARADDCCCLARFLELRN